KLPARAHRREDLWRSQTGKRGGDGKSSAPGIGTSSRMVFSFACNSQDDLAVLATLGDAGEGSGRILELKDRVNLRSQLAGVSTRGKLEQLFAIRLDNEVAHALRFLGDGYDARPQADGCRERMTANGVEYELARLRLARQLATRKLYGQMSNPAALPE